MSGSGWLHDAAGKFKGSSSSSRYDFDEDPRSWSNDLTSFENCEFSMAAVRGNEIMEDFCQVESGRYAHFFGVYDGHRGPEAAQYLSTHLLPNLLKRIPKDKKRDDISGHVLSEAVSDTEEGFMNVVESGYETNPELGRVGSCCLCCYLWQGFTINIANLGDSRAILCYLDRRKFKRNIRKVKIKNGIKAKGNKLKALLITKLKLKSLLISKPKLKGKGKKKVEEKDRLKGKGIEINEDRGKLLKGKEKVEVEDKGKGKEKVEGEDNRYHINYKPKRRVKVRVKDKVEEEAKRKTKILVYQLTTDHNCSNNTPFREQLMELNRDDPEFVVCNNNAWRVKGISKISKSIGDAYLKLLPFTKNHNFPKFEPQVPQPFTRGVMTTEPEIVQILLNDYHQFMILASHGFWELLSNEKAAKFVHKNQRNGIAKRLVSYALHKAAKRGKLEGGYKELEKCENRRQYHDDITVTVVFFGDSRFNGGDDTPQMSYRAFAKAKPSYFRMGGDDVASCSYS